MTAFTIHTAHDRPADLLIVNGDVDCSNAGDISAQGVRLLDDRTVRALTIDFGAVTFCDAAGLGALIQIRNAALLQGKTFRLGRRSNAVEKLLTITGLDIVFGQESPRG